MRSFSLMRSQNCLNGVQSLKEMEANNEGRRQVPNRCQALPVPGLWASLGACHARAVTGNRLAVSCAVFSSASPSFGIAGDTESERIAGTAPISFPAGLAVPFLTYLP